MRKGTVSTQLLVCGAVQGVGFRPFVYGLATVLYLGGWVRNTSAGVEIVVQGQAERIEQFLCRLRCEAPPLARIESITTQLSAPHSDVEGFAILPSTEQLGLSQPLPPDAAICPACARELFEPKSRRHLYPFISCTNCGPRFTIINELPCDRAHMVMAAFPFCPACAAEYDNPLDRRFHAQASACPACGPQVRLREKDAETSKLSSLESILRARQLLREGRILAIKGLGGFHLACAADNAAAVAELRCRKQRPDKPFALMAADVETIRAVCQCGPAELDLLQGSAKPVVLLTKKNAAEFPAVAPQLDQLGFMLPYTPLHCLLLNQTDPVLAQAPAPALLVMTSGNRSGEPIAAENEEALARLALLADAFLLHDRPILTRCDDSVVCVSNQVRQAPVFLRRSRGYAPYPLGLPVAAAQPLLAVGGEQKNTFCLVREDQAFLSQHIGELDDAAACAAFEQSVAQLTRLFRIQPELVAHDLHPLYFATRYAQQLGIPHVAVQHHHAHIAACMADNGLSDRRLIGLAFDGTGYGSDGAIWGGEVLLASYTGFERFAHLQYLPLPGGETAIRQPWRIALGYAHALGLAVDDLPFLSCIDRQAAVIVRQQVEKRLNAPLTSSMGRLFDAVASLIGVRNTVSYEGQAAMELEVLAKPFMTAAAAYPCTILGAIIHVQELLKAIICDLRAQEPAGLIAARFHQTVTQLAIALCTQARNATGLNEAALSGGVWQNQLLLHRVCEGLAEAGFTVYVHKQVPANDGGLSLGQAAVAQAIIDYSQSRIK